jgi:hypothetical protein
VRSEPVEWPAVKKLVEAVLHRTGERSCVPFAVRYAGGGEYRSREAPPAFTLVFKRAAAYARIAAFGHTFNVPHHKIVTMHIGTLRERKKLLLHVI